MIIQLLFINVRVLTTQVAVTRPTQKHKHNTGTVEIHETLNRQNKNSTNTKSEQAKQLLY